MRASPLVLSWTFLYLLSAGVVLASEDSSHHFMMENYSDDDFRDGYFRAEGEHTCWSDESIGHKCFIHGTGYTDCKQAYLKLKKDDCCAGTEWGGMSVAFKLNKCTRFN